MQDVRTAVALVNMPFSYSKYPSIQLGTLSALLKSKDIPVDCHHLNVRFAHKIGVPLYETICEKRALFGEWIFSYLLFRDNPKRAEYPRLFKPVFEQVAKESGHPASFFEDMAARTAPQFLTWALTAIDWGQYKIVGFTSTFDQNVASLTMAKLIKDLYPNVTIVFGGANYDGEMGLEYFRAFPFIDHVVVGEGEEVFPLLVRYILAGTGGTVPGGVVHDLPSDLREALIANATALDARNDITPLARNEFICWVEDAKQAKTRQRRIARTVEELLEGKRRPCCWSGCIHRTDKSGRG